MIHISSGEEFESFFSLKMNITVLKDLPKASQAAVLCSDIEGRLCFFYSKSRGKGEKRTHQFVLAHSKAVYALDCSDDYLVTADEGNMVIIWTFTTFIPISNLLLPTSNSASINYNNYNTPTKKPTSDKPYPVEVVSYKQQNHLFLILQSNGVLHLIRATDNTLLTTFKTNVGNFAHINIDYFDKSILTVDEGLVIRLFSICNETVSPALSLSEDQNTPVLTFDQSKSNANRRKTQLLRKDSRKISDESPSQEGASPSRKTRFSKGEDTFLRPIPLGGPQAESNSSATGATGIGGVLRRRGVYAAGRILKIADNTDDKNVNTEWSLSMVEKVDLRTVLKGNVNTLL